MSEVPDLYATPTHTAESLRASPTRPPFGYFGVKIRVAGQIISGLPKHNAWVEAFCGSAALTLAKPPSPIEVINDYDDQVVNVFEQLRCNAKQLCEAVALTPYSRAEFEAARGLTWVADPLESARRFLVATMMTINATIGEKGRCGFSFSNSYSRGGREARVNRWYKLPERLEQVVERLRGVRVEKREACDLLAIFADRPATLVYLDPPYYVQREHKYVIDANDREYHARLLDACNRARCMILLSGYENELYDELLKPADGWTRREIRARTKNATGQDSERTEILWMNGPYAEGIRLGRVPVELTKKELGENKLNPSRPL